jgi:uncharacterized protein
MEFKLSRYIHISRDEELLPETFFLYATRTGGALELDMAHHDDIVNGQWESLSPKVLEALFKAEAIVPKDEDELDFVLKLNKENIQDNDQSHLSFTIQPTANCQLGCHYCGQQHAKKVSNDDTNTAIFNRIVYKIEAVKNTIKSLNVTWYGGEPLTGLSSIEDLSAQLIKYCDDNGIYYHSSMITNGLALKYPLFVKLVNKYRLSGFQITVDGTAEFHDKRRMLKTGAPSFDIIFSNLKEIVHSDFYKEGKASISIRSNVDGQNKENIFELLDLLHEEGILKKVGFNTAAIHDWGDNGASKINGISKDEYAMFEIDIFLKMHGYGVLQKSSLLPLRKFNVCMVANTSSEVYDAYGNVSTCWEVPYTPVYDNTGYYAGNLHKDPELDTTKVLMREWFDEIPTNSSWCKGCKFFPVCGGSCPKHWQSGSIPCPSFKQNIDERIFLNKLLNSEPVAGPAAETIAAA